LFLVMPLVTGSSLDRARDRYGDLAWAQSIVAQISDALVAMHERGIVHRDLKPSNVLLDGDRVKVTDFGISNVMATASGDATPDGDTALAPAAPLTRTGHLVGTPRYMAPELAGSVREAGPAADIFSLGVIAYELFSSKLPYTAPPIYERLAGRTPEPPPVLATLVPTLPSELAELVDRCLASSIDIRPSARELAVAFRRDRA
jgi:serine/threonine-protein kinase